MSEQPPPNSGDLRFEVVDEVRVLSVDVDGDELRIDVYGGAVPMCATLVYTVPDAEQRSGFCALARRWCRADTALTYIRRGDQLTLVDPVGLLQSAASASA